jgi:hypothetical protein
MKVTRSEVGKKVLSIKDFRGADYASSPLEVKPYRATDMANLIMQDGMLRKRNGFKQLKAIKSEVKYTSMDIYPFGKCKDIDELYIVRLYKEDDKSCQFYRLYQNHGDWYFDETAMTIVGTEANAITCEYQSSAVKVGNELCIFCGLYVTTDGEKIYPVNYTDNGYPSHAYIPKTVVNVPATVGSFDDNALIGKFETEELLSPYESAEALNMLTAWQSNMLVGKSVDNSDTAQAPKWIYYKLSGKVGRRPYLKVESKKTGKIHTVLFDEELKELKGGNTNDWVGQGYNLKGSSIAGEENIGKWSNIIRWVATDYGIEVGWSQFYLLKDADYSDKFVLYINPNFKEFIFAGENSETLTLDDVNLYLEFVDTEYKRDKNIITATTATVFGVDGASDRIFVAGGVDKNILYYSENDISFKPNPTYFPANQFVVCGTANSPICGFSKVTDGTLAIFKDVQTTEDVAVYYTSGYYVDLGTDEAGNSFKDARFTVSAGDISRKGVSAKAIANLEGDNLFVSKDGVYGIQLSSNVASGERYAKERSRTINPRIRKLNLQNARAIVYRDRYYLAVDNGEVYVADSRYRYTLEGDQQDTFNYEWFRWTGLDVANWFEASDGLYFIDKNGMLCKFTNGYADEYLLDRDEGDFTFYAKDEYKDDPKVVLNADYDGLVKASAYFKDDTSKTWTIEGIGGGDIDADGDFDVWFNSPDGLDTDNVTQLWFNVPVAAYWESAVFDLGSAINRKTLWSMSATVGSNVGGKINLGYKTRVSNVRDIEVEGANTNAFDNLLFVPGPMQSLVDGKERGYGMFTFDIGGYIGVSAYRRRVFERNFVYLQLLFVSDTTTDCTVSDISVEYSYGRKNIGVG